jgi:hypothetical protein
MDEQFTMIAVGIALTGLAFMVYQNNFNDIISRMYKQSAVTVQRKNFPDIRNPQEYDDSFVSVDDNYTSDNQKLLGRQGW